MAKIVVAGVLRNCSENLARELESIQKALAHHEILRFILVESDSTDNSKEILEYWSAQSSQNIALSLGSLQETFPSRTARIAYCRNVYLEVCERENYFGADYLFVSDLDGVNTHLSAHQLNAVINSLQKFPKSAATANQLYKYYDIWALRHEIWSPNDCWSSFHKTKNILGEINAHNICNSARMIHIPASSVPIEVESAFGGGAIYSVSALYGCKYDGLTAEGLEICEHVTFSQGYRKNGGTISVYPNFINHDKSPHVLNAEQFDLNQKSASIITNV